jgi:predicted RNA-binding Zn ribbon-like protein
MRRQALTMNALYDPGLQSGGRRPAPGRLALVQAFVNSFYDLGAQRGSDLFATPHGLAAWLEARGLAAGQVGAADLRRAIAVREGLRAQLLEHNGIARDETALAALRGAADGLMVAIRVDAGGRTEPVTTGPGLQGVLGLVLAIVHEANENGSWQRLKACPGRECGWAFYDYSPGRSSAWCSMRVCGGREKARAYRRRTQRR